VQVALEVAQRHGDVDDAEDLLLVGATWQPGIEQPGSL